LEIIDLNENVIEESSNVLDEINNEGISGKLTNDDRDFFKDVFHELNDALEPKGKHHVDKKSASQPNNFEK
jgi:hypothetical protein